VSSGCPLCKTLDKEHSAAASTSVLGYVQIERERVSMRYLFHLLLTSSKTMRITLLWSELTCNTHTQTLFKHEGKGNWHHPVSISAVYSPCALCLAECQLGDY